MGRHKQDEERDRFRAAAKAMTDFETPSSAKLDEAVAWHVRLGSDEADERVWQAFTAWLEAGEENRTAAERVEAFTADLDESIRAAGAAEADGTLVRFSRRSRASSRSLYALAGAGAALAAAVALFVIFSGPLRQQPALEYRTAIGGTKTVTLSDGSVVDLNTGTRIRVSAKGRRVELIEGQALFHVAKDAAHPFVVSVGDRTIEDLGTVFDVLRNQATVTVTVAEGRVGFAESDAEPKVMLLPGDQLVYSERSGHGELRHVNPNSALAWRNGYLIYQDAPLPSVVADINRYFSDRVVIGDSQAAAKRFSGVLRMDGEDAVLQRLSHLLPVEAVRRPDRSIALQTPKARD